MKIDSPVTAKVTIITPAMAEEWLKGRVHNRPLRENDCFMYAELIEQGKFYLTHQGVAFDEDGQLIDGQHRLQGIALSRIPTPMMVTTGLKREVMRCVDTGRVRNVRDNIAIATGHTPDAHRVKVATALLRFTTNRRKGKATADEVEEILKKHEAAFDFITPFIKSGKQGIAVAWVGAIFLRTYYDQRRRARASELMSFLVSGYVDDSEPCRTLAVRLRDYLLGGTGVAEAKTQSSAAYMRVERAIRAFLDSEPLTKLVLAVEEQFPFPGEVITPLKRGVVGEFAKMNTGKGLRMVQSMTPEERAANARKGGAKTPEAKAKMVASRKATMAARRPTVTMAGRL